MAQFRPVLAARGLTEPQWRVLRVLFEFGPLDPTEIAERSVIMGPSVTRILKTLAERQLITRTPHAEDRRRVQIALTEKARREVGLAAPHSNAVYADIEQAYGKEKLEQLLGMLRDLAKSPA